MITSKEIGKKIANIIKSKGITQRELAEQINISESTLSRYIKGERMPKLEILYSIAEALNISIDALIGRPAVFVGDDEFGMMLNCAVRYALGRCSYMPKAVVDYITPLLGALSAKTVWCLEQDFKAYQNDVENGIASWGQDFDENLWKDFGEKVKEEAKKRK